MKPPAWADLTVEQTREYMGLSRTTVNELVKAGTLVAYKISAGRRGGVRIRRDSIEKFRSGGAE